MGIVTVGNQDSGGEVEALSSDTLGICWHPVGQEFLKLRVKDLLYIIVPHCYSFLSPHLNIQRWFLFSFSL